MQQSARQPAPTTNELALGLPAASTAPARLRLVPPRTTPYARPPIRPLPPARQFATVVAQAIAEVLCGLRPADQLAPVTALDVRRNLERQAGRLGSTCGAPTQCPTLTSVRITAPIAGAIEACAVVATGGRRHALAFRLDATTAGWKCTAVRAG